MIGAMADNEHLAAKLEEFAALLELAGAGYYSIRAYRRAAELVRGAGLSVAELVAHGRVRALRGIGPGVEARLRELVETGEIAEVVELRQTVPIELAAVGLLHGFGAKRGAAIGAALGIRTASELREAAQDGRLREVPGIGPKTEAKIVAALASGRPKSRRPLLLPRARELTGQLAHALGGLPAGDARRWADSSSRLAVVVVSDDPAAVRRCFAALPQIVSILAPDPGTEDADTKELGVTTDGVLVELTVTDAGECGTALVRATGPDGYVASLEPLPAASTEEEVFQLLGRPYAPPELRGSPLAGRPPDLVELDDIRGDLHAHTIWSDGKDTVLEMGTAARERGYEYLAICDHTPNVGVVPGLDAGALRHQAEEIAAANERLAPFRVLRGVECDIRRDASLDLPDDVLAELDWVQLSLHAGQRAPRRELTARVTEAMRHPAVRCLSHPTGRLIGHRPENALDLERTVEVALETGVAFEVNGLPSRLDLAGEHVATVLEAGASIVCSTDAHSVRGLGNIELSVRTARRGGATAAKVLNTRSLEKLLER
jgi:DNA polymerase (family 10)